jgi:hypothetical protein
MPVVYTVIGIGVTGLVVVIASKIVVAGAAYRLLVPHRHRSR